MPVGLEPLTSESSPSFAPLAAVLTQRSWDRRYSVGPLTANSLFLDKLDFYSSQTL